MAIGRNYNFVRFSVKFDGDGDVTFSKYTYFGEKHTEGTIRISQSGGSFLVEKLKGGIWVQIQKMDGEQ